ncbi:MAG TPA: ATP-binding protein, partial [Anaerolineales bacterium]|nr:ATP-binding protein [Anaerolineales bacterium]
QGNLWVGMSGSGLARFDPRSGTFKNYSRSDGLQSDDFMPRGAHRDADGKLYFGGINGLNAFYPDQLRDNPYIPPVVLTDFQIFNRPVPIGEKNSPLQRVINETDEITLSYQQSVFSFEFAALSYRAPRKNRYAYKLEGFDADWNYVGSDRRFATYTNLNPGTYTFRVKASNNDGVWNEEGKTVKITVTPPWWKTWWFYTLCVAGVLGVFGMIYLTKVDQLKAERQTALVLRESERRFQILAEAPFEGIALTENGVIVDLNDQMAHMLGYARGEMIGRPVMEIIAPESRGLVAEAIRSGRLEPYEHLALRKDGTLFPVETRARAIQMNGRQLRVSAIRDITEHKQAEAEREHLIIELENRNAELERFTYTVSHDLKSPLVTITGFLGYLEKDALAGNADKVQVEIQRITQAAEKMRRLLQELLELSRIGRIMNPPQETHLRNLVNDVIKLMESQLQERNIAVEVQDDLPILYGDSQRLLEVIQNLLDNAIKFMGEQPKPVIEIGTRGEENGMPVIFVRDNGVGIAPQYHERVFGLFNKLNPGIDGTGVGLAIVKRIIEVHKGRIWVESEEGKGATFYFTCGKEIRL